MVVREAGDRRNRGRRVGWDTASRSLEPRIVCNVCGKFAPPYGTRYRWVLKSMNIMLQT